MKYALLMITVMFSASCGPGISTREKERQQIEEDILQLKARYAGLAGRYEGDYTTENGKVYQAILRLHELSVLSNNSSRNEPVETPTLGGSLALLLNDPPDENILAQYQSAKYTPETSELKLFANPPNGNGGTTYLGLTANINGDRLVGRVYTARGSATVNLVRVQK